MKRSAPPPGIPHFPPAPTHFSTIMQKIACLPAPCQTKVLSRAARRMVPIAGWSSQVARQAHNLKVRGSNPLPATTLKALILNGLRLFAYQELGAVITRNVHTKERFLSFGPLISLPGGGFPRRHRAPDRRPGSIFPNRATGCCMESGRRSRTAPSGWPKVPRRLPACPVFT